MGAVLWHPTLAAKTKNAARVGHPHFTLTATTRTGVGGALVEGVVLESE